MSNVILKTLKIPGLTETFLIPAEVEVYLNQSDKAYLLGTTVIPTEEGATITAVADNRISLENGVVTAVGFSGNLNGSNIIEGTVSAERLPTMIGATGSTAGIKGIVPAAAAGDQEKFLRADGSWAEVSALTIHRYIEE